MALALKSLKKAVTTAGTRVALAAAGTTARRIMAISTSGNTGSVYLGDVTVASSNGLVIPKDTVLSLAGGMLQIHGQDQILDLSSVYLDAATNGDAVTVLYSTEV